jgi:hypothetical protein
MTNQNKQDTIFVEFIQQSVNYDSFDFLAINRDINEPHVKALMESFQKWGSASRTLIVIESKAITGKYKRYYADGQHSVTALKRLGLAVDIKVVRLKDDTEMNVLKFIAMLNNSNVGWSNERYLESFSQIESAPNYKLIKDIKKETGLTMTDLLLIFLNGASKKENKMFKDGELDFPDRKDSDKLLEAVLKVKNEVPNKAFVRRKLIKVFRMAKDYNRMTKAILKTSEALKIACSKWSENETEFYNHLVDVYQAEFKIAK